MTEEASQCSVEQEQAAISTNEKQIDPFKLKEYETELIPADGGQAPLQKTAEPESYHDNRIYVSNIPFSFDDQDLVSLFNRFGEVKSAMIVCNDRGSKGFGFVTMDSIESCETARHALHGTRILGRVIEVRKATPLSKPAGQRRGTAMSTASSVTSSPRRGYQQQPRVPRKKSQIAINPHIVPMGLLPANVAAQSDVSPVMSVAAPMLAKHPNQQNALNLLLGENPILLQSLLAPYSIAHQPPATFFPPPPPMYHTSSYIPCAIPPLSQAQPGFAYVATLPHHYAPDSSYVMGQAPIYVKPADTSLLNNTLMSTSMTAHMQGMQDNLVNLLNLDGTLNHSKLMELKANSLNNTALLNSSAYSTDLNDSGRKRRAASGGGVQETSPLKQCRY